MATKRRAKGRKPKHRPNRAKSKFASYHEAPASVKRRIEVAIQREIHAGYDIPQAVAMTYRKFGIKPRKGKA